MLILATAFFFRTLSHAGIQWTGATTAYVFALLLDALIATLLIISIFHL